MAPLFLFFVFFFPTWGLQNKVLCWTVLQSRIQKASKSSAILICIVVDKKQTTVQNFRFVSRPSNWLILFKKKKNSFVKTFLDLITWDITSSDHSQDVKQSQEHPTHLRYIHACAHYWPTTPLYQFPQKEKKKKELKMCTTTEHPSSILSLFQTSDMTD